MKKRNRVLALTVAAAMSASLLAGCGSSAQQGGAASSEAASTDTAASVSDGGEDNIIRVGVVCSMTGGSAIYGEGAQNAVDMAVEEINAGDSGYKIEIVKGGKVADDAKDAKQAINAYNKVMDDSPEAIVGSFFSSVTLPMAEQASKDGMLLLATGATNADVTLKGNSIFRNCFIDPYQGKMEALFAKDKGFAKVAVIYAKDDDYSNGLKDAFVENCEANGIEVAYVGECMTTDTDYSSQAAQAVASGADLLYYPCFLDTVPLLVGAARNAGFTGAIMGGDGWDGSDTTGLAEQFDDCYGHCSRHSGTAAARRLSGYRYALYSEIIDTYNEIISDGYYDAPLMLEYNTWRDMTMLDGGNIKGNFKFDDVGQPLSTASGNMPDIECDYDDFVLSVEVTMQQGQRQYESEGEPVARHFGQMKKRTGKEAYCLFIAPTINKACLAHFFALNKIGISYYGGKTKIIPLELDQFMRLVENSYNYHTQPTPHNIRQFLDEVMRQEELATDENDWNEKIQNCVTQWLAA